MDEEWICEYCGQTFSTEKAALRHEEICAETNDDNPFDDDDENENQEED